MSEIAFPAEGTRLLRELAEHNDRIWFAEHKAEIERNVQGPATALLDSLGAWVGEAQGRPFTGKIFRLHRDVRFSKDKTPYTPYVRLSIWPIGTAPCFFCSFETDRYVVGAGIWEFGSEGLNSFRSDLTDPDRRRALDSALASLVDGGVRLSDPELARAPKGAPPEDAIHLRRKGLTAWFDVMYEEARPVTVDEVRERVLALTPLFQWLEGLGVASPSTP